ncbi:hypothetical protein QTJ16_000926 [Diplocarpon rosae]|uniref:Uncharacterized protein n=1 Tax=Diplocarpon rosae TaxID=946125 RepID=A0AAD9WHP3_9HELO|nr:hypothetical protein QTJ16_000926 [Diplocarpon rosae]
MLAEWGININININTTAVRCGAVRSGIIKALHVPGPEFRKQRTLISLGPQISSSTRPPSTGRKVSVDHASVRDCSHIKPEIWGGRMVEPSSDTCSAGQESPQILAEHITAQRLSARH